MRRLRWLLWAALVPVLLIGTSASGQSSEDDQLLVTEVLPQIGTTEVQGNSVITVIFNRPMIPLETVEDTVLLPQPLDIQPALKGKGEWLNTSVYVFHPDGFMRPSTLYTVTVKSGLTSTDGLTLVRDYSWLFHTQATQILRIEPGPNATGILLDPAIKIYFNQPVNHAQMQAQFYLHQLDSISSADVLRPLASEPDNDEGDDQRDVQVGTGQHDRNLQAE